VASAIGECASTVQVQGDISPMEKTLTLQHSGKKRQYIPVGRPEPKNEVIRVWLNDKLFPEVAGRGTVK